MSTVHERSALSTYDRTWLESSSAHPAIALAPTSIANIIEHVRK
jgi:hypothetical protein